MNNQHAQDPQLSAPVIDVVSFKPLKFRQRGGRKVTIPAGDAVIENRLRNRQLTVHSYLPLPELFIGHGLLMRG